MKELGHSLQIGDTFVPLRGESDIQDWDVLFSLYVQALLFWQKKGEGGA